MSKMMNHMLQMAGYAILVAFSGAGLFYVRRRLDEKRKAEMAGAMARQGGGGGLC
jgi:hypothetical protein